MSYYLDIFSPSTYEAFSRTSMDVTGVTEGRVNSAEKLRPGDKLVCYLTKLSRWVGILEVQSGVYRDETPRFQNINDPYVIRVKVKPVVWLEKEKAIPIREDFVWEKLSLTRDFPKTGSRWTGPFRSSLNKLSKEDGKFLEEIILSQFEREIQYPFDKDDYQKFLTQRLRTTGNNMEVSIPENSDKATEDFGDESEVRESIKTQAILADIGEKMGYRIWLPRNDRGKVLQEWKPEPNVLLDVLPLNYDQATIKTIEQIDVLWIKRSSIIRAFEVEHTTSIYSGILRMADLLALQPNMDIKLHLVAPDQRKYKVFNEIQRPVFLNLERGPLSEYCTFISYDSLKELAKEKHLTRLPAEVLEDYEEIVE